jgi:ATP-binding cassette, subfamily B, multidrug efflux pump
LVAVSRPLFAKVQMKLSLLNTTLQENIAGIKVVQAFTRELSQQTKFERQADDLMKQQITIVRLFTFCSLSHF